MSIQHCSRCPLFFSVLLSTALFAVVARANDGRDRYQQGYPNVMVHLDGPLSPEAGYRVLADDMEGGADGDPAFRWGQKHALAVVEVAARHTRQALGMGPFEMALFDMSAENGDTPVDFGWKRALKPGELSPPPRGRHPGGSHDGGLNLDLGYYLTSLKGKVLAEDYAACTEHHDATARDAAGKPVDVNRCTGPADRLDVERQSFFVLELLKLHRDRFGASLIDESGMDQKVKEAVLGQLLAWEKSKRHGVTRQHIQDLEALFSHDRWGGWQKFHHHHMHLRIQPFRTTGPLRDAATGIEVEARKVRAGLLAQAHADWPVALDAQALSYKLERSVEVHAVKLRERPTVQVRTVRFRLDGGEWVEPDEPRDDFRYIFDLPPGLRPQGGTVTVEAEVSTASGKTSTISTTLALPRLDPRLFVAYQPGAIGGGARIKGREVRAQLELPVHLKPLVTGVRYLLYPADGGAPEVHVVDAGWFAPAPDAQAPEGGTRSRGKLDGLPLVVKPRFTTAVALVEAQVMFSSRMTVSVPLLVQVP
ncbi:MAG: hypothetical protein ABIJ09_00940 [Pseudomonadota bacterium]